MGDLTAGFILASASLGIVAVAGMLVWLWMKVSPRFRKQYRRFWKWVRNYGTGCLLEWF